MSTTVAETQAPEAPAPPVSTKPAMSPATMVDKFIALRDKKAELAKKHAEELAPYNLALGTLEAWMLNTLNETGLKAMRAGAGTFYTTTRTSAKVETWGDVLAYIRENEAWELLEARVSKTAVEAIMEDTQTNIPGVTVSRELVLNVRRA